MAPVVAHTEPAPYPEFDGTQVCAEHDPELFFPGKGQSSRPARALCAECPFARECLAYALTHQVRGVWGGTSFKEREEIRAAHGIAAVPMSGLVGTRPDVDTPEDDS